MVNELGQPDKLETQAHSTEGAEAGAASFTLLQVGFTERMGKYDKSGKEER